MTAGHGTGMPRTTAADAAVNRLARSQLRLATTRQLRATGLSPSTAARRCASGGPWQRLLPGVVLIQTGDPDARQRLLGAVLYAVTARGAGACPVEEADAGPSAGPSVGPGAGPDVGPGAMSGATAVLTGEAALALYGVRGVATDRAEVLVASRRSLRDTSYVRLRRTTRWPPTLLVNGIPCVRPVRAASDFARHEPSADRVRAVLANTVQKASCHPEDLRAELRASHALRNPALRAVIHELRVGVRSIAEGETRDVLTAARVPPALWNPTLLTASGAFLARPDAYWPHAGVALEVDSEEYHLGITAYRATLRRRLLLESHGVDVVSAVPALVRDHPQELVAAVLTKLRLAEARKDRPSVVVRPHP